MGRIIVLIPSLDWEDRRCAAIISGTSRLTRYVPPCGGINPKTGLDVLAPVIDYLIDRESGTGTVSVVNNVKELCIPILRNASGEFYLF